MLGLDHTLLVLLVILGLGLIVPELFKKLRLPYVTSLILIGAALGPYGFDYIKSNEIIEFFGFLGFTFLMFMGGLETKLEYIKKSTKKVIFLSIFNGGIPFLTGFIIAWWFNYSVTQSLLVGTIFLSSSLAIIIPSIKEAKLFKKDIGQLIISSVLLQDMASLFLLAIIFHAIAPVNNLPLILYFLVLVISILFFIIVVPKLAERFITARFIAKDKEHENQLRFIILILIAVLLYFELLGVHPILAAFIVGVMLNHVVTSNHIYRKLHTIGYGLFVPIFFFIVGMELDLGLLVDLDLKNFKIIVIILSLMLSKYFSGYIAGNLVKLKKSHAKVFGTASMIKLTTTLAVAYTASTEGILDNMMITAIVLLAIITTIFVPIILKLYVNKLT